MVREYPTRESPSSRSPEGLERPEGIVCAFCTESLPGIERSASPSRGRNCASRRSDRRHVAQGWAAVAQREQRDSQHDERHRETEAEEGRARPERRAKREEGADHERPAADVVHERGAAVQPPVLLVSEEGKARNSKRERHRQAPGAVPELPARETEVRAAGEHHHLRPGEVRDQVNHRPACEHRDGPHRQPHYEAKAREEIAAPSTSVPDIVADDRLRKQTGGEDQEARREHPVDVLGGRFQLVHLRAIEVADEAQGDEPVEEEAGHQDEQRRFNRERPEAAPIRVEEREAIHLSERPQDSGENNQRPDRRDRGGAPRTGHAWPIASKSASHRAEHKSRRREAGLPLCREYFTHATIAA